MPLLSHVGKDRANELDRSVHFGLDLVADLLVGYRLGGAPQPRAGVADDHFDVAQRDPGDVDRLSDLADMCQVESGEPQPVAVLRLEVVGG
nr:MULTISPECIES: hypothetical protein [unclassified Streptomyces]